MAPEEFTDWFLSLLYIVLNSEISSESRGQSHGAGRNIRPVSLSVLLEVSWKETGGFTPAPMHSSREKRVYQSSVQWMLAALVFSSSWRPKATSRLTRDRTCGFIISRRRREWSTYGCAERAKSVHNNKLCNVAAVVFMFLYFLKCILKSVIL